MNLEKLVKKIAELLEVYMEIKEILTMQCWEIILEDSITYIKDSPLNFNWDKTVTIEKKRIPEDFFPKYRNWYSLAMAIMERNYDKDSIDDFKKSYKSITFQCNGEYITKEEQIQIEASFKHQMILLRSLPSYIEGKIYDLELNIATTIMGDELKEAKLLLDRKFIRAAGAVAGVILERYLKTQLNRANPPIKYGEKATLGSLIEKIEASGLFEETIIQKLRYLNAVRIKCDHDKEDEPQEIEVKELIDETDKFLHYINV